MHFGHALTVIKAGGEVRREAWESGWLTLQARSIMLRTTELTDWRPTSEDLLAEDWTLAHGVESANRSFPFDHIYKPGEQKLWSYAPAGFTE